MPTHTQYVLGAKPGDGGTAKDWNVILPIDVLKRRFDHL